MANDLRKVFRFTEKSVERIAFKRLKKGDQFYMEDPDGTLDVHDPKGRFICQALENAKKYMGTTYGLKVKMVA